MSKFSTFQLADEPRSKANGQPLLVSSTASTCTLLIDVRKQGTDQESSVCVVVPCSLSESISTSWYVVVAVLTLHLPVFKRVRRLHSAFTSLEPSPTEIYVAITTEDTSTVYYKISQGIVKPPV